MPKEVIEVAPLEDLRRSQSSQGDLPAVPVADPAASRKRIPRSSERELTCVPVVVYGWTSKFGTFQEETETAIVNSSGAQVMLKTKLELGDVVFLIHKSRQEVQEVRVASLEASSPSEMKFGLAFKQAIPGFWKRSRKSPRVRKTLRVVVKGEDAEGNYFIQSAYTVDLSQEGARLDGVGFLTTPGQILEIRRLWRKAKFRVVWTGQVGTTESNQIGVFRLQADKDIWHARLPEDEAVQSPKKPNPPKK